MLLLGEQALVTLLALPIGCALGYALSIAVAAGLQTETYRIPLVVSARTYLLASTRHHRGGGRQRLAGAPPARSIWISSPC